MFGACLLAGSENLGALAATLDAALAIILDGAPATDAEILALKSILDAFANQKTD